MAEIWIKERMQTLDQTADILDKALAAAYTELMHDLGYNQQKAKDFFTQYKPKL